MFDEQELKIIFQPKDYINVTVYDKNGKEYDVRFQDGKYLIDANVDTTNHMSNTEEIDWTDLENKYNEWLDKNLNTVNGGFFN